MSWLLILLIVIVVILIILYAMGKISGSTFWIIILVIVILLLIIPALLGISIIALLTQSCQNKDCSVVKLPVDINKVGPATNNSYLYQIKKPTA